MGNTSDFNESNKIDLNSLLNEYFIDYKLEQKIREDVFITIVATTKKEILMENLKINSGIPLVFKIFPIKNSKIPEYVKYTQEFINIIKTYSELKYTPNILPLLKMEILKDINVGILTRQYIKYNLNDIQYHMHCVTEIEKKWICFQLLQGLSQIHSNNRCHGDIKPNNILLTSKLSVFLSDISVYKPAYINIEFLSSKKMYFYSNEYDKSCYLAPERFINNNANDQKDIDQNKLTPEMDIFSLGVVMSEIFLEKFSIFTQSEIINAKKKNNLKNKLEDIKDLNIRLLLQQMIEIDPKKRPKLNYLIDKFNNILQGPITSFIARINLMIIAYEYHYNDLLVGLLYKHFQQIWKLCIKNKNLSELEIPKLKKKLNKNIILYILSSPNNIYDIATQFRLEFIKNNNNEIFTESDIIQNYSKNDNMYDWDSNNDGTIIIVKYLLSCLENIKYISTFSVIFEMLFNLSKILVKNDNSSFILDIIVPYYLNLFKSSNSRVIIETFNCLIDILLLIDFDKLILNQIDYNSFNNYIFDSIYKLFLNSNKFLDVQCSIISRLDDIIKLENNFLFSYLKTIDIINSNNEKLKEKNKNLMNSIILFQSLLNKNNSDEFKKNKKDKYEINFKDMYNAYSQDLISFKKKLKDIIGNILANYNEEQDQASHDCLKLLLIQKYREICMFFGSYEENFELFSFLCISFNRENYFIQKEIIKIFPSLILLFGRKLYLDFFLPIIESIFQKKNSELMIIEITDAIYLLTKMNLISHDDDYSKIYKILIPYLVHPNYLLRYKLEYLFNYILSDQRNSISQLYFSFYHNIKNILLECKPQNNDKEKKKINMINVIETGLINSLKEYYTIPREIFLIYKYDIESNLFNLQYSYLEPLLNNITKIKKEHFENKIQKNEKSQKNLGLVTKNEIFNLKEKKFYDTLNKVLTKILKNERASDFFNHLMTLYDELNTNNENFMDRLYELCRMPNNIKYSYLLYLLKVLNINLKYIELFNSFQSDEYDDFNNHGEIKGFTLVNGSTLKSIKININMNYNFLKNTELKGKLCYKLNLNKEESIIKLIPINNLVDKKYVGMFISISDIGMIRFHIIYNEPSFDDIYTIKNSLREKIFLGNYILKPNNISYIEQPNRIIIILSISKKLQLITFNLNEKKNNNPIDISYESRIECQSSKEIIALENIYNIKRNYLTLGNIDNSLSFYDYTENKINYINNCSSFSASYGNIQGIITLSASNNILVSTSNGFVILYDYNLRFFTYVYSFSKEQKIRQIIEYIPFNEFFFEQTEKKPLDKEKGFLWVITDDNEVILWNLSQLKPNIICKYIKTDKIEKSSMKIVIPQISKLPLENNEINDNYLIKLNSYLNNDFSILNLNNDNEIIKMDIPMNFCEDYSFPAMIIGDKLGNIRLYQYTPEILKKIKKKEGHHNNKYNQIIISNDNINFQIRNDSKYLKSEGIFFNKHLFNIKYKDSDNKNLLIEEMKDLLFMKDFDKNNSYIITSYSNGIIKLYSLY